MPADIERALAGRLDEGGTRDLQLEARAHVRLQAEIDKRFEHGRLQEPASKAFVQWLHQSFFTEASTRMLTIRNASGEELVMQPGQFRTLSDRLLDEQLLASETPKGDLFLRFTSKTADVVFPRLFPASG